MTTGRIQSSGNPMWCQDRAGIVLTNHPGTVIYCIYCAIDAGKMAAIDEDDRPKKKVAHEIGQDLALLSVEELNDRISLLNDEVARLRAALEKKRASRSAADQFFKR